MLKKLKPFFFFQDKFAHTILMVLQALPIDYYELIFETWAKVKLNFHVPGVFVELTSQQASNFLINYYRPDRKQSSFFSLMRPCHGVAILINKEHKSIIFVKCSHFPLAHNWRSKCTLYVLSNDCKIFLTKAMKY